MTNAAKLGNADFQMEVEAAAKGLAEASDGVAAALRNIQPSQLHLYATWLGAQYDVQQEMYRLGKALREGDANSTEVKTAFNALVEKATREGSPLKARIEALRSATITAETAKDPKVIARTIEALFDESGLQEGPVRNLLANLKTPIAEAAEHGVRLTTLIENQAPLTHAQEHILTKVAKPYIPQLIEHIASLKNVGITLPAEFSLALEQLAATNAAASIGAEAGTAASRAAGNAAATTHNTTEAATAATTSHATTASSGGYTSSGSSYSYSSSSSSTPSTTVSGEGRQWYQWLTHEEEAGKTIFSGKRTAIAAGAGALVAGGIYLLKRNKNDETWQSRTSEESRPMEAVR